MDETIAPSLYRTGRSDRLIPLALGILLVAMVPALLWISGPFLWPWGFGAASVVGLGALAAFRRWRTALVRIRWIVASGTMEFLSGRRCRRRHYTGLTRIETSPSGVRTRLWFGAESERVSHRLLRIDALLGELRRIRPDLFPALGETLMLRMSMVSPLFQAGVSLGTALTAVILAYWVSWLGWLFAVASVYVLVRIFFFIPRGYLIGPTGLTVLYLLRKKWWGRARSIREEGYAAGGALFFRMRLDFGVARVVLDEGHLREPLRPLAGVIVQRLLDR